MSMKVFLRLKANKKMQFLAWTFFFYIAFVLLFLYFLNADLSDIPDFIYSQF